MDFSVDRCRRRPPARRLLIYLDTSTYGKLAQGVPGAEQLSEVLERAIESERAICVGSPWHEDEIANRGIGPSLDRLIGTLRTYTLDLRMRFDEEVIDWELSRAARQFSGQAVEITWDEAFRDDPDDPPLKPFQAKFLNERDFLRSPPADLGDVEHERQTSGSLAAVNLELREAGFSWEDVARGNLEAQVRHLLGPLVDPDYLATAERRQAEAVEAMAAAGPSVEPGSPVRKYMRFAHIASNAVRLRERYPAIASDPEGFSRSDALQYLPVIRLFPFLLAALSVDGRRTTPQPSDLHDVWHLTYGLSRCDVVTADRRSCEWTRGRNLVPADVQLVEAHRLAELAELIEAKAEGR